MKIVKLSIDKNQQGSFSETLSETPQEQVTKESEGILYIEDFFADTSGTVMDAPSGYKFQLAGEVTYDRAYLFEPDANPNNETWELYVFDEESTEELNIFTQRYESVPVGEHGGRVHICHETGSDCVGVTIENATYIVVRSTWKP